MAIVIVIIFFFILGCHNTIQDVPFDLDIRSIVKLAPEKGKPRFKSVENEDSGISYILTQNFLLDTIYLYEVNKIHFFFYKEKDIDGVLGGDNFIFYQDPLVYKVRVSNQLAPDSKHYVSVLKYTDTGCINYEGKAKYNSPSEIEKIKEFNVLNLFNSLNDMDSSVFKNVRTNFRLASLL